MSSLENDLAAPEVWDLVKLLNDRLKAAREQIQVSEAENEQMKRDIRELKSLGDECNTQSCPFAVKYNEMKGKTRHMMDQYRKQLAERDAKITELQHQASTQILEDADVEKSKPHALKNLESSTTFDVHSESRADIFEPGGLEEEKPNTESTPLPDWSAMTPCFRLGPKDPLASIPTKLLQRSKCQEFLYCSNNIFWDQENSERAYVVLPGSVYDPSLAVKRLKRWSRNPELNNFQVDQSREVFYCNEGYVYYAGTFKCHQERDLSSLNEENMSPQLLQKIRNSSLINKSKLTPLEKTLAHERVKLEYQGGKARLVCFIWQYTGFNSALYNELVARFHERAKSASKKAAESGWKKRKLSTGGAPAPGPSKRPKVSMSK